MRLPLVFILTPEESFTPTRSGAIATHTHACCLEAQKSGIEPIVIARPCEQAKPYDDVQTLLFPAPTAPSSGMSLLFRRVERRLRHRTNLCHAQYVEQTVTTLREHGLEKATLIVHNDPELLVDLRRHLPGARLVHWFHNQHTCKPRPRRALGQAVDAAIAVSDFTRQWVIQHYQLPESRVYRIYNGVDIQAFHPRPAGANGHAPMVNFTGRTGIEKAPDLVLAALLEVTRRGKTGDFSVQFIGANHWGQRTMDDYQRQLDDQAARLRSQGIKVDMPGHLDREQTAARMRQADIHIVPSRWDEPFGLTTVEGMASGLATIGSRTGGTPEIIADAGLLFERDAVGELADHLELLIGDGARRAELGQRARARAEQFTWAHTWAGLEAVLEQAA